MPDTKFKVAIPGSGSVSAVRTDAVRGRWTFVYAPGAGSNINDPFGIYLSRNLPEHGVSVVRLQFPYMEAGRSGPDRPPVLEATWNAVIEAVRKPKRKIAVGGRSMGGRIASQVAAQGTAAHALALFAYPLHPPGKPDQLRIEHLPDLKLPSLFVSGTRDAFGSPDEIEAAARKARGAKVHFLEGADHGFAVKKSSGRTKDDVFAEATDAFVKWLLALK
jgi:predicted alpha/beta-hydrolase family hydrolase